MREFKFNSEALYGEKIQDNMLYSMVKNEPMLFNCDWEYAWKNGGSICREFMTRTGWDADCSPVIDSRVQMLMPGWYPCIPGWHHDDVPRTRADGQPNYLDPQNTAEHAMLLVNAGICPTEFAIGSLTLEDTALGDLTYRSWNGIVDAAVKNGFMKSLQVPERQIVFFDHQSFHRGVKAISGGWRYFIRASRKTTRVPTNEIRRQVQVYLEFPMEGW